MWLRTQAQPELSRLSFICVPTRLKPDTVNVSWVRFYCLDRNKTLLPCRTYSFNSRSTTYYRSPNITYLYTAIPIYTLFSLKELESTISTDMTKPNTNLSFLFLGVDDLVRMCYRDEHVKQKCYSIVTGNIIQFSEGLLFVCTVPYCSMGLYWPWVEKATLHILLEAG